MTESKSSGAPTEWRYVVLVYHFDAQQPLRSTLDVAGDSVSEDDAEHLAAQLAEREAQALGAGVGVYEAGDGWIVARHPENAVVGGEPWTTGRPESFTRVLLQRARVAVSPANKAGAHRYYVTEFEYDADARLASVRVLAAVDNLEQAYALAQAALKTAVRHLGELPQTAEMAERVKAAQGGQVPFEAVVEEVRGPLPAFVALPEPEMLAALLGPDALPSAPGFAGTLGFPAQPNDYVRVSVHRRLDLA